MKKYIYFLVIVIAVLFLSSNHYLGGDPVLPGTAYSYNIPLIPDHLDTSNYGTVEDTVLTFIDDYAATLGRVLFYDELLSANDDISCATCHLQEFSFADTLAFSHGVTASTARNSMQLNDLGWTNNSTYFWDMRLAAAGGPFDTLLANAIKLPLADPNEIGVVDINFMIQKMNATTYYPNLFNDAYGSPIINEALILKALSHFICSMVSFDSKFDQAQDPSTGVNLSASELNGMAIFDQDCVICHTDGDNFLSQGGPIYGIFPLYDNGMPRDTTDIGAGEWNAAYSYFFKSPTLRNIEVTGPYMHDARFTTLEEVVDHYSDGVISNTQWIQSPGFVYSETNKIDLIAFLKTLTDQNLLTHDKWSDPFSFISETESIEDFDPKLTVAPNPSSEYVSISFENDLWAMTYVQVFSLNGQLMAKRSTHKTEISVNVGHYPAGTYLIKLRQGEQEVTKQLVVVK